MTHNQAAVEVITFGPRGFLGSRMFTSPTISIGRHPRSNVHLDDPSVSLEHAVLFLVGDEYCVKDLGSRAGTLVNGQPATLDPVGPTDEIEIGAFRLRITVHKAVSIGPVKAAQKRDVFVPTPAVDIEPVRARYDSNEATAVRHPDEAVAGNANPLDGFDVDSLLAETSRLDAALGQAGVDPEPWRKSSAPPPAHKLPASVPPPAHKLPAPAPLPNRPLVRLKKVTPAAASPRSSPPGAHRPKTVPLGFSPKAAPAPAPTQQPVRASTVATGFAPQRHPEPHPQPEPARSVSQRPPPVAAQVAPPAHVAPPPAQVAPPSAPSSAPMAPPAPLSSAPNVLGPGASGPHGAITTPRPEVAARAYAPHDDDEDDEDEASFVPTFDLFSALMERGMRSGSKDPAIVQVVRFAHDRVLSVAHLGPSAELLMPGTGAVIGGPTQAGGFAVEAIGAFAIMQDGRMLSPEDAKALVFSGKVGLVPGRQVKLVVGRDEALVVHLVPRAPDLAVPGMSFKIGLEQLIGGASSTVFHVALLALISVLFLTKERAVLDMNEGRFATIAVKEIELEAPTPIPQPTAAPPRPDKSVPVPTKQAQVTQAPQHNQPSAASASKAPPGAKHSDTPTATTEAPAQPSADTSKILSMLDSTGPKGGGTSVTNLDAAPRGSGGGGGFKLSGPIGKAPGDTLRIGGGTGGGGDGQVGTKSVAEVGKVGRVEGQAPSNGPVRAHVTALPQAVRGEGHLDRGEIQRVVNAHVQQIQGCYERQLMKDPTLSGKITMEWVIDLAGRVASVRVKQSSLRGVETASCIQGAIQGWHFPTPEGGTVTVTYPFAFSTLN